jgi:hypothetical protein
VAFSLFGPDVQGRSPAAGLGLTPARGPADG